MNRLYKLRQKRINLVIYSIFCIWGIIFIRLFYIQIIQHSSISKLMARQSIIKKDTIGERGIISDRNFIPLSQNINRYTFWVNTIQDEIDIKSIAEKFSNVFNKSVEQYIQKLQIKSKYNVIEKDVLEADCLQILQIKKIKGLNTDKSIRRYYPYSDLAAQLIGYTDLLNSGVIDTQGLFKSLS